MRGRFVLLVALFAVLGTIGLAAAADTPTKEEAPDYTAMPTVKWLPRPFPVEDACAKTAEAMKPYTERIPGTDLEFDMVPIPGGTFLLGSPEDEDDRDASEGPQVTVKIEPFWMGKYEVTWDEYETWSFKMDVERRRLKKESPSYWDGFADAIARPTAPYVDMTFNMGRDNKPAICMTQFAAKMYCKWLAAKTGRYYRLPTGAEWEYACRAGTTTAYSFGDDPDDLEDYGWYFDNSDEEYGEIGQKKPNPWGLYDMHGNVSEWVLDQLVEDHYAKLAQRKQPVTDTLAVPTELYPRVVRGGSWDSDPEDCRSASRLGSSEKWKEQDPQIPQSIWYHTDAPYVGVRVIRPLRVPTACQTKHYEPEQEILGEYREAHGGRQ